MKRCNPRGEAVTFRMAGPRLASLFLLPLLLGSCVVERRLPSEMPMVRIQTTGGFEQGVSTDDGILFLGRTQKKGPAKVLYYLGPSPMMEAGELRHLGASLYEVETEIALPSVPISMESLRPGEELLLMCLDEAGPWSYWTRVAEDSRVSGPVIEWPSGLTLEKAHVGAGLFRESDGAYSLVGLLKGTLVFKEGARFLVMAGLPELRRALLQPQAAAPPRIVKYRADAGRVLGS